MSVSYTHLRAHETVLDLVCRLLLEKKIVKSELSIYARHIVLDGDPAPSPKRGAEPPQFSAIFVVAKQLDASRCHLVWR